MRPASAVRAADWRVTSKSRTVDTVVANSALDLLAMSVLAGTATRRMCT